MSAKINIKEINKKLIKRQDKNIFQKTLLIIIYPFLIIFGGIFMFFMWLISLFQKNEIEIPKKNYFEEWNVLVETKNLKIFKQYFGEIRFGPAYFKLKSEPKIAELENKTFGDWFFKSQNYIFLQQWNSTDSPKTNLILINCENLEVQMIKNNLKSVNWEMKDTGNYFELTTNTGYEIIKYEINKNGR